MENQFLDVGKSCTGKVGTRKILGKKPTHISFAGGNEGSDHRKASGEGSEPTPNTNNLHPLVFTITFSSFIPGSWSTSTWLFQRMVKSPHWEFTDK
jgi:hypothetical protein